MKFFSFIFVLNNIRLSHSSLISWLPAGCENNLQWRMDLDILPQGAGKAQALAYFA